MKVLIIDNYDSFTFNLFQYCGEILDKNTSGIKTDIIVKRNDQICLNDLKLDKPDKIIISPVQDHLQKKNILESVKKLS